METDDNKRKDEQEQQERERRERGQHGPGEGDQQEAVAQQVSGLLVHAQHVEILAMPGAGGDDRGDHAGERPPRPTQRWCACGSKSHFRSAVRYHCHYAPPPTRSALSQRL